MSFVQQIDGWEVLTNNAGKVEAEHPEIAAVRAELQAALNEAKKSREAQRRLRSRMLVETKRMRDAVKRGQQAEQRLRRFLQAAYGPSNPQLHQFGLKARKARHPAPEVAGSPLSEAAFNDAAALEDQRAAEAGE
jgi:hypothetical protein